MANKLSNSAVFLTILFVVIAVGVIFHRKREVENDPENNDVNHLSQTGKNNDIYRDGKKEDQQFVRNPVGSVFDSFTEKFHYEDSTISVEALAALREYIENADNKLEIALKLIGGGTEKFKLSRAIKVGEVMEKWPEDYAKAIGDVLAGSDYKTASGFYATSLLENNHIEKVISFQLAMKMGSDRANIGRKLVTHEVVNGTLEKALERVSAMPIPLDKGESLKQIVELLWASEEWASESLATDENFKRVSDLAEEAGFSKQVAMTMKIEKLMRSSPLKE